MEEIFNSVSNRECASLIWLTLFIIAISVSNSVRSSFGNVLRSFMQPLIVVPLLLAACYATLEVYLLAQMDWWSITNLKTSAIWVITFAFVGMFEVGSMKQGKSSLRKIARDIFSTTMFLTFILELKTFSLSVEMMAVPAVTFVALLAATAKLQREHAPVDKLLGWILLLIGTFYVGHSLWLSYVEWQQTATCATALEFFIPIMLSVGFLPFLYAWHVFVAYNAAFATISIFGLDEKLLPYARWLAITRIRGDTEFLERWRQSIQRSRPVNKAELKHSLVTLRALVEREKAPPVVQPIDGWSPYLAMQFMADYGIETGHYHHSYDDEWCASSSMREIGEGVIWKNNIAYYIEGNEHAVTTLKLKMNINDLTNPQEAEGMFINWCMHLLEQAVSFDAIDRMKMQIVELKNFESEIPFGKVQIMRDNFLGGITGGYSRKLVISRGVQI